MRRSAFAGRNVWRNLVVEHLESRLNLAPVILAGDHVLLPNASGQQISILTSGVAGDEFEGVDLHFSIGGGVAGPIVTAIDLVGPGTLFHNNNFGQLSYNQPESELPTRTPAAMVSVQTGTVGPSGVLAVLTVDTTGIGPGVYSLSLTHPLFGKSDLPPFGPDDVILVDGTLVIDDQSAPIVNSIAPTTLTTVTNASSVSYTVSFNEPVVGVDATDFDVILSGGTSVSLPVVVSGSGATYLVAINGIVGDGTVGLSLVNDGSIQDPDTNILDAGMLGPAYTIDGTLPVALSIERAVPVEPITNAESVTFVVTFSEPVTGVDVDDFFVTISGDVAFAWPFEVSGEGAIYAVTINGITGDGTLGINLVADGSIQDLATNMLLTDLTGAVYTIHHNLPFVLSILRSSPSGPNTNGPVTFTVSFNEPVLGVDITDFVVHLTGNVTYGAVVVSGGGSLYTVQINGVSGNGTLGLELIDDDSIVDLDSNPMSEGLLGPFFNVDQVSPSVQSINRTNPAGANSGGGSVTYTVTFTESVTGVDEADFALALTGSVTTGALNVSGSGLVYSVTVVSVSGIGSLGLNLVNNNSIRDLATNLLLNGFTGEIYSISTSPVTISGRHIFYNQSVWDGNSAAINAVNDNAAIATDKTAYLPNATTASYNNITSFSRGINGIMVDLSAGVNHTGITASDFVFKVGNNNMPGSWAAAPTPTAISVIPGGGTGGSDRVEITWASGAIRNTWLEVQVLANANTGLPDLGGGIADVHFWGNRIGDSGTSTPATTFSTTTTDASQVFATIGPGKPIVDLRDYNRDGQVTSTDAAVVFANIGNIVRLNIAPGGPFTPDATPAVTTDGTASAVASALAGRTLVMSVNEVIPASQTITPTFTFAPIHGNDHRSRSGDDISQLPNRLLRISPQAVDHAIETDLVDEALVEPVYSL